MGHSVAGACLEEPAVLTAFPSLLHPQDPPQQRDRILFVTAELSDFVKVGGLGDFSAALPRVLKREHSVRVLLPGYRQVLERCRDLRIIGSLPGRAAIPPCEIGLVTLDEQDVYSPGKASWGGAAGSAAPERRAAANEQRL